MPASDPVKRRRHKRQSYERYIATHPWIFCECGCGERIPPIHESYRPRRFAAGHQYRPPKKVGATAEWRGYLLEKTIDGWQLQHRVVWEQEHGEIPEGKVVHHKNHDRADNRVENLELLTRSEHGSHHSPKGAALNSNTVTAAP